MQQTRPMRRRERRVARRAAWHAERLARAATPAERLAAAAAYLVSAAAHARRPAKAAREAAVDVVAHARQAIARAELSPASRALHEAKLTAGATEAARLASALMVLRSALSHLPAGDRDRLCDHYAGELAREADQIAGR